jgi:hypothetical protein
MRIRVQICACSGVVAISLSLLCATARADQVDPPTSAPASQPADEPARSQPAAAPPPTVRDEGREPIADDEPAEPPKPEKKPSLLERIWSKTILGTTWYLAYLHGKEGEGDERKRFNKFHVGRGYLTAKFKPFKWFQPRITLDTHQDDEGDWEVRLKYIYAKLIAPIETSIITKPSIEFGIVHTPWFDYEEHINLYRMEGTMFIERNGSMNSADLGFTIGGLFGRKLPDWYLDDVDDHYPGQWGSFAFGLYNGGGYHAAETNNDKVFEARISVRPLGLMLPNLQLSYFTVYGKGNTEKTPNWRVHDVMLSFEQRYFTVTGQFAAGEGNQKGSRVDETTGEALSFIGGSGFGEIKIPRFKSTVIARYDYFDWDKDGGPSAEGRLIAGYAFHFLKKNFVLASIDHVSFLDEDRPADWQVKVTMQVYVP